MVVGPLKVGTSRFHVESPYELAQLDAAARAAGRQADVLFRVNPAGRSDEDGAQLVMGGRPSPFGRDLDVLRTCAASLRGMGAVRRRGLAGAYAWNISHHSFLTNPPPAFYHLT